LLIATALFGVALGLFEAAVVVDLRAFYEPIHRRLHPESRPDDLFPILTLGQLRAEGDVAMRLLVVELGREAASIALLVGYAAASARSFRVGFAVFAIAFGVWDIAFYGWLRLMLAWPASLLTWDLLFLLPVPWSGPVLAPVLVALTMVVAGVLVVVREGLSRPIRTRAADAGLIAVGALILVAAFCWDWRGVMAGRAPGAFRWDLYAVGMACGLMGFLRAASRPEGAGILESQRTQAIAERFTPASAP
jgi:hypothetical protein